MARMISFPSTHLGADASDGSNLVSFTRETQWEITEAQHVVHLILGYNGLKLQPLNPTEAHGWDIPDVEQAWDLAGDATIDIPDLSKRYKL